MDNLDNNQRATLVKEIAHIHFTALTDLYLGDNRIESVEGLARVQMPHIELVNLSTYTDNIENNNITSVRVIRKAAWPHLISLNIGKRMNNVEQSYFGDANSLMHGCFPQLLELCVYDI
jgi:hypothetical protein